MTASSLPFPFVRCAVAVRGEPITGVREHVVEFVAWATIVPLRIIFHLIRWPELS